MILYSFKYRYRVYGDHRARGLKTRDLDKGRKGDAPNVYEAILELIS